MKIWLKQLRLHQAAKNFLIFLPLVLSQKLGMSNSWIPAVETFVAFTMAASGTYIWNDLKDLKADRAHPTKQFRPLAASQISSRTAIVTSVLLVAAGFYLTSRINLVTLLVLGVYLAATVSYTLYFKRKAVFDVAMLASLYTLRVIAGAVAVSAKLSIWIALFALFEFYSLAIMKRYSEVQKYGVEANAGRGYKASDAAALRTLGIASGMIATLVLGLYLDSHVVSHIWPSPVFLWGIVPLVVFWTTRMWIKTERGEMNDDPVIFALKDRGSLSLVALSALLTTLAMVKFH